MTERRYGTRLARTGSIVPGAGADLAALEAAHRDQLWGPCPPGYARVGRYLSRSRGRLHYTHVFERKPAGAGEGGREAGSGDGGPAGPEGPLGPAGV